jgi:SWI/SNF-related matrix-associated actin-dependent regulator of chromatin subfamily A member 5
VRFHGSKEERAELTRDVMEPAMRDENRKWNVCVTTYEVCNIDQKVLNKFAWNYLIIDEAHRLKNEASSFSKTIRTFETRYRLLLTGTPLQNNLHELWSLLNFLVPDVFASAEQFDEWFNLDIDDADEKNKLISQLHKILRPFMLRRLKADVEKDLPPKHETILYTGMSAMQKKLYKDILLRDIDVVQGSGGGGSGNRTAILNIVMQLRKCAGHPYLFPGVEDRSLPPLGEHLVENCGKMVLLDKLLKRLKERGHRVLLFTQMTRILDILEDYMVMRQFKYCRIDGNTSYEQREEYIDAYNAPGSEKFIFLLSTRAGGLGINLQTADVVILFDSDWNPQADLQAQDRAHRIGQKRRVQVFRFVTEHTIEEKVVERAQQKLKLDAMVVQSGRLKEKDKLSSDELLAAVRFGADKIFKSKDSSITNDDIDLILDAGKRKTQELNEKLQKADKGDMLDFKLDGGLSAQTFEGVDYSGNAFAKAAQAEFLMSMDIGKRERKTVANYNENQLYQQQIAALQGPPKPKKKKVFRLPKAMRLPRLEEWQMYDRTALLKIQEEEENAFRELPEEHQKLANMKPADREAMTDESGKPLEFELPQLLSPEQEAKKKELLSGGFSDWGRQHYMAFIKGSARYGRSDMVKIAKDVGKPLNEVETYAAAFWDENMGKKRFSEHEYERVVKLIERGEKKIEEIRGLERGTRVLLSLFDNPWEELEFTYVNCKDKQFSMHEDRSLLCWACKYGYGQWEAVKMAIRRSPNFRFDYFLRSLPSELIGRRCEQLMKAAEKEVEQIERKVREDAGLSMTEEEKKGESEGEGGSRNHHELQPVEIPNYRTLRAQRRLAAQREEETEHRQLEEKVVDIANQIQEIQDRLKVLNEYSRETAPQVVPSAEFPDELLPELANTVAKSGPSSITLIASSFAAEHPGQVSKKKICSKIDTIATKEKRESEGDKRPCWYLRADYEHLLDAETLEYLQAAKEDRLSIEREKGSSQSHSNNGEEGEEEDGAVGPDGEFVLFPEYDGSEPPKDRKKAFTHFCNGTRKEVKKSLDPAARKNKEKVNSILREKWYALTKEDKQIWKQWEQWDAKRHAYHLSIYNKARAVRSGVSEDDATSKPSSTSADDLHVPKKRKVQDTNMETTHIPKKVKK